MLFKCDYCGHESEESDGVMFRGENQRVFKCGVCCDINDTATDRSDYIECPYCGHMEFNDLSTYKESRRFRCPACAGISELSVYTTSLYSCRKIRDSKG